MKRRILLLMMTALLSVGAWATTENVWTGSTAIGWYQGEGEEKEDMHLVTSNFASCYSKIRKGDNIVVTVTMTGNYSNSIQVLKSDGNGWYVGGALTEVVTNYEASETPTKIVFPVTDAILEALAVETSWGAHQLFFYGNGETVTSVDVEYNNGKATIYNGQVQNYGWGYQLLPHLFTLAQAGDVLSIDVTDIGGTDWGANINIANKSHKENDADSEYEDLLSANPGTSVPTTVKFVLTEEVLTTAKSTGLYLNGGNYTYTSVDLLYTPTVSISAGYATLGYATALDLTDIEAYTAAVIGDEVVLSSVKGKKIPAGTGIILKGSGDVTIPLTTEATDEITSNELLVSDGTVTGNGSIYVLANKNDVVGFYRVAGGVTIPAGKAYLEISGGSNARGFIGFGDDNGTTGIDEVSSKTEEVRSDYYDLQGRRVAQPTKGLYIVNGKKVIIK